MARKNFSKLYLILGIVILLLIWEAFARIIKMPIALPTMSETMICLFKMVITGLFWKTLAFSLIRIAIGFTLGVTLGIIFALISNFIPISNGLISPIMTVARSTPVACFIMILWLMIQLILGLEEIVPIAITVLMIMPVIWQNVKDGFSAIDKDLSEVCRVFEVRGIKKMKYLYFPTLIKYLAPGIITSVGLGWKAGIAAEIIAYTSKSIGKEIYDARVYFESEELFAWTIVVIALSLIFEGILARIRRRNATKVN